MGHVPGGTLYPRRRALPCAQRVPPLLERRTRMLTPYATNNILFVVHFWFMWASRSWRVTLGTQYASDCPNVRSLLSISTVPRSPISGRRVLAVAQRRDRQFHRVSQYGDTRCVLDYYPIPFPGRPRLYGGLHGSRPCRRRAPLDALLHLPRGEHRRQRSAHHDIADDWELLNLAVGRHRDDVTGDD